MFNPVRAEAQDFIQYGPRHCPKTVAGHFLFRNAHAAKGSQDGVITHGPAIGPRPREDVLPAAGYGVNLKMMFSRGLWLAGLLLAVIVTIGYLVATYWPGFGIA